MLYLISFSLIHGWSRHHYITENALFKSFDHLDKKVKVEKLESFVKDESEEIQILLKKFETYLKD